MTRNKIFSVICPVYNDAGNLEKTLESVIRQNGDLYEIVVVDGNSVDNTVNILERYRAAFPDNFRCISEPDKGIYDAMNKGIDLSRGEYLIFLGAGDTLKEGILDEVKPLLNFDDELVYGNAEHHRLKRKYDGEYNKYKLCIRPMPHQASFYRKTIFDIVGRYNQEYALSGDYEFEFRVLGNNRINVRYIDLTVADYEGFGYSSTAKDELFFTRKPQTILKNFGKKYSDYYISNGQVFLDFVRHFKDKDVVIFGNGKLAQQAVREIENSNREFQSNIQIKCFFSSDSSDNGKEFLGRKVEKPCIELIRQVDRVIIASEDSGAKLKYLSDLGVEPHKTIMVNDLIYNRYHHSFLYFIKNARDCSVVIFGTGNCGEAIYSYIHYTNERQGRNFQVRFFMDNDCKKWGAMFNGKEIMKPEPGIIAPDDNIFIASAWSNEIRQQLLDMGVTKERIIPGIY